MPARRLPTSFLVHRPITLAGTTHQVGESLAASLVASFLGKRLEEYVNRGYLSPVPNQYPMTYRRLGKTRHGTTFHLSPKELRTMVGVS